MSDAIAVITRLRSHLGKTSRLQLLCRSQTDISLDRSHTSKSKKPSPHAPSQSLQVVLRFPSVMLLPIAKSTHKVPTLMSLADTAISVI